MERIIKFIKKNWIFLLFIIAIIFDCLFQKFPDNDLWFLLKHGEYVFKHGIPLIEPLTMHEGLDFIMQQWGSALIFYNVFNLFGGKAFFILVQIMFILYLIVMYKLFYIGSKNRLVSVIGATVGGIFIRYFVVTRPQIFSYILLFIELILLEKYAETNNKKYLWALPIFSILLINLHASMWHFQFVFMLPFIINAIKIKKFKTFEDLKIDHFSLKPLLLIMIPMIIAGFINPYGYKMITYVFKSYGIADINKLVTEMHPLTIDKLIGKYFFSLVILVVLVPFTFKKSHYDIRHILLLCGGLLLGVLHIRCFPLSLVLILFPVMYALRNAKIDLDFKFLKSKVFKIILTTFIVVGCYGIVMAGYVTIKGAYHYYDFNPPIALKETTDYLLNNYDVNDIRLYNSYDCGGYLEFRGIKTYIDPRAEVFTKKINGKADILKEYIYIEAANYTKDNAKMINMFIDKYNFTHFFLYDGLLNAVLANRDDYVLMYRYNDTPFSPLLYVRKDLYKEDKDDKEEKDDKKDKDNKKDKNNKKSNKKSRGDK